MNRFALIATTLALTLAAGSGCSRNAPVDDPADPSPTTTAPPAEADPQGDDGLQGSRWRVVSVDGAALPEGRATVTIEFVEPGRLAGQGPCNRYMASYDLEGGGFRVGQAASTMMACEQQVMDAEQSFLELLGLVQRRFVTGDALQLVTADNRQIYAERL